MVPLFSLCMGGIMYFLELEVDTMAAPFLRGLLKRFLASRINNPGPSSSASYSYFRALSETKAKAKDSQPIEASVTPEVQSRIYSGSLITYLLGLYSNPFSILRASVFAGSFLFLAAVAKEALILV